MIESKISNVKHSPNLTFPVIVEHNELKDILLVYEYQSTMSDRVKGIVIYSEEKKRIGITYKGIPVEAIKLFNDEIVLKNA